MKSIKRAFSEHPEAVGETYFEHMGTAFSFSWRMFVGSIACFLHGVFPFLCVKSGSAAVTELHERMVTHRNKHACDQSPAPTAAQPVLQARNT